MHNIFRLNIEKFNVHHNKSITITFNFHSFILGLLFLLYHIDVFDVQKSIQAVKLILNKKIIISL